jgi:sarcosine oxidase subunit alpha
MTSRLPGPTLRINPAQNIQFRYCGCPMQGVAGDTVATALYSHGVRIFSRSFKYHRPRGLYSMDGESSNCMVEINGIPNVKAEITRLQEGMDIRHQNVLGSAEWDWLAVSGWFDWAMHPGFYYKAFHKPWRLWPVFQNLLRHAAGLGKLREDPLSGAFENVFLNCDICVIGGGPAGLSAALAAADTGVRVVLIESRPHLGGFYDWRVAPTPWGEPFYVRGGELSSAVERHECIRVFQQTHLTGIFKDNLLTAVQSGNPDSAFTERYIEIRAGSVIVATGCGERPLLFEHNDRPGIMQCGCAHRLARTYGLLPGKRAVVNVCDDLMLEAAIDLADLGLEIEAVADIRSTDQNVGLAKAFGTRNIPFLKGWIASETRGKKGVKEVLLTDRGHTEKRWFRCDLFIGSAGQAPLNAPLLTAGGKVEWDREKGLSLPVEMPPKMYAAGRLLGWQDPRAIETSGRIAGLRAAEDCGQKLSKESSEAEKELKNFCREGMNEWVVRTPGLGRKSFVCFDEDVSVVDIHRTSDEGYDTVELCKRYSTAGMGSSQGGIPGDNLPLVLAEHQGVLPGSFPPSRVRSPLRPTLLGTLVGKNYYHIKQTPLRAVQERLGGVFIRAGQWERVQYFGHDPSAREEILNVHTNVGLMDVSTLGKFRIVGKDALKILQRIYVSDLSKLEPMIPKYSALCNEDGCVIDDGLITKKEDNDYYVTTTSARASVTEEWFAYHSRFEEWDYHLYNLTDVLGAVNLAGPRATEVLARVMKDKPPEEKLPSIAYLETTFDHDMPVRLIRTGFVSELSWEIHAPASAMPALWQILWDAGVDLGIRPFGLEAQNVLRLERGHVIIGEDSELRTNLLDIGLGFLWDKGKRGTKTPGLPALWQTESQQDRLKLVGFRMEDPSQTPPGGSLIVDTEVRGYVTSSRRSEWLNQSIGLALVDAPLAKTDFPLSIFIGGPERRCVKAIVQKKTFIRSKAT